MAAPLRCIKDAANILLLALAVEVLYLVPYGLTGTFRPIFQQAFDLSNHDLGRMSSAYGLVSMCCYIPGGFIADRFQPKLLMAAALLITAACCLWVSTYPSVTVLVTIWGILAAAGTLLFWSALVAAIRQIGGEENTGKAFGFEQFSRGLLSTLMTLALSAWIRNLLPVEAIAPSAIIYQRALDLWLNRVAWVSVITAVLILSTHRFGKKVPPIDTTCTPGDVCAETMSSINVLGIMSRPAVWLHALIVVAAYCGNLATGYFSGLATNAYGMDAVHAAEISSLVTAMRSFVGILTGLAADHVGRSRLCFVLFLAYACAYAWVALMPIDPGSATVLQAQIAACAASVYGLAGVYFTLLDEAQLPLELTGSAVGVISVIGFTPDIFLGQVAAYWLDKYPGKRGYQSFYMCIAGVGCLGALMVVIFAWVVRRCQTAAEVVQESSKNPDAASGREDSSLVSEGTPQVSEGATSASETTSIMSSAKSATAASETTSIMSSAKSDSSGQRVKQAQHRSPRVRG